MIRVVIDTNVFLSALISPHGAPNRIVQAWQHDRIQPVTSLTQLAEIRRVSRYAKMRHILQPHRVGTMVNNLRAALILDPPEIKHALADPDDAWMLDLAKATQAQYLVTGDKRAGLLALGRLGGTRILTAAAFCDEAL